MAIAPFNAGDLHSDIRAKINQAFADLATLEADIDALTTVVSNLTTTVNGKQADLDKPSLAEAQAGTATIERVWDASLIAAMINSLRPLTAPFANASGPQTSAPSGGNWKMTGTVSAVPITNGWFGNYVNTTTGNLALSPAGGQCIVLETGVGAAAVTVQQNKGVFVVGDGTNLIVSGDVL